jgi:hypothetical protein
VRHRLLPQPSGFKGSGKFGPSTELSEPDEFPVAELPRYEEPVANPGVTSRHRPRKTPLGDDLVAAVVESVDLLKGARDALPLFSHYDDDCVVPSPSARLNGSGGIDVLGLRIDLNEDASEVLAVGTIWWTRWCESPTTAASETNKKKGPPMAGPLNPVIDRGYGAPVPPWIGPPSSPP